MATSVDVPRIDNDRRFHDIHFREIQKSDWTRLQRFHLRLSPETVERRFHGAKRELSAPLAHRFTDVNGQDDVAIVATTGTRGRIVGVARYCRMDERTAEVAVVVEDGYQGRGIGKRLMRRIRAKALENGIQEIVGEVLPGNVPMFKLLREMGETHTETRSGVSEVRVLLRPDGAT